MYTVKRFLLAASMLSLLSAPAFADNTPLTRNIAATAPHVFTIFAKKTNEAKSGNIGTGSIIDDRGYIITNSHVVHGQKNIVIYVGQSKEKIAATLVGEDVKSDLAVLKIDRSKVPAGILKLGDSDKVVVGDQVIAIGAPYGLAGTVTVGHVSTVHRNAGNDAMKDSIQTDADINPGNSGGPLINSKGEMIGVNSAAISPSEEGGSIGLGLAIPSNHVKNVFNKILKDHNIQ